MSKLYELRDVLSRSITAENPTGEKNSGALATEGEGALAAKKLGVGWKVSPCIKIKAGDKVDIANIAGPGIIKSMWYTFTNASRLLIIRIYWEDNAYPSVCCPVGDFFFNATGQSGHVNSKYINVNSNNGNNSFWEMPFNKKCRIEIENIGEEDTIFFYQINYELHHQPITNITYFHAFFKRDNPLKRGEEYVILPKIAGKGALVATYLFWQVNNNLWWGEGEFKAFIDGDEHPTICGTGTEDYFGGAWNFESPKTKAYKDYTSLYFGFYQEDTDNVYKCNKRFNMYRIHNCDPIYFSNNLEVKIQALGWKTGYKDYNQLSDDISSLACLYLENPTDLDCKFSKDYVEII